MPWSFKTSTSTSALLLVSIDFGELALMPNSGVSHDRGVCTSGRAPDGSPWPPRASQPDDRPRGNDTPRASPPLPRPEGPATPGCAALRTTSSSRRRSGSSAHPSRSRVGLRFTRRRASLASLTVATTMIRCTLVSSRLNLGVCLWRRRSSVASLVIAAAWWAACAPLAPACRLTPPAPSHISRVARRHDSDYSLRCRAIRGSISACASGAVDVRLLRWLSRRLGGLLARLSRSRVGLRFPRARASLVSLVVTSVMIRCIFRAICGCISACASGAVDVRLLRSSSRRRGGLLAHLSRARVSACAYCDVARFSSRSSWRRR